MRGVCETSTEDKNGARRLVDPFGRAVSYLRLSVTDRCDLRCHYCMSGEVAFKARQDLLSLEELDRVASAFVDLGVDRIRLTGGEPLLRRGFLTLARALSRHLVSGKLRELTLTTNGGRLAEMAADLADCGIRRVNVSLDTLDPGLYRQITRGGSVANVLAGIEAARAAGLKVKINCVALKGVNEDEFLSLVEWAHGLGIDVSFIEVMPLGDDADANIDSFLPLDAVAAALAERLTLSPSTHASGGPAHYFDVAETGGRVGFITPLSQHFCDSCNRVRVTCTGAIHTCLGQENQTDLRGPLRSSENDSALHAALDEAMRRKPRGHDFVAQWSGALTPSRRPMSLTGG